MPRRRDRPGAIRQAGPYDAHRGYGRRQQYKLRPSFGSLATSTEQRFAALEEGGDDFLSIGVASALGDCPSLELHLLIEAGLETSQQQLACAADCAAGGRG